MSTTLGPIAAQRARNARLQHDAEQLAVAYARAHPTASGPAPVVLLPANTRALVPLPAASRAAFLTHLQAVLAEVFAQPLRDGPDAPHTDDARADDGRDYDARADAGELMSRDRALPAYMVLGGCSTCRGACCTSGGTRAFLTAESLRRVREHLATRGEADEGPGDDPGEVAARYAAALPTEHYEGSCVFHARAGCTLPRVLRANLCNRYQCGELTALRRALDEAGANEAYVAAASAEQVERVVLVRPDGLWAVNRGRG